MKKNTSFLILFIFHLTMLSQARFEKGYYLDSNGTKIDCELETKKWSTWNNNELIIKKNGTLQRIPITNIKEFGIEGHIKFITQNVDVDASYNSVDKLDDSPNPTFENKYVLLKVLVEGKYSLYQYLENNIRKFYYSLDDGPIKPLIYKRYLVGENLMKVRENNEYLNQLNTINHCKNKIVSLLEYQVESLKSFFIKLNECSNAKIHFLENETVFPKMGAGIFAGVNVASFKVKRLSLREPASLSATTPTFGIEGFYDVPLIQNAVRFKLNASYSQYEVDESVIFPPLQTPSDVSITYSDILFGGEAHYVIYTAQKQSFNIGLGFYTPIILEDYTYTDTIANIEYSDNKGIKFVGGIIVGYTFNRFNLIVNYSSGSGNLFKGVNNLEVNLQRKFSFRLGYQIL